MGRRRKLTKTEFRDGCERYFMSVTRIVPLTEKVPTGEKDEYGHTIFRDEVVFNTLGEKIMVEDFLLPPTVEALCDQLGIDIGTFENYKKIDGYRQTCERVLNRIRRWNMEQLLTRSGKDVAGIKFNLENNFGMREKAEVRTEEAPKQEMTIAQKQKVLEELIGSLTG